MTDIQRSYGTVQPKGIDLRRQTEADRIWGNTKRFVTATSEVATLFDLFDGLKKSGYAWDRFQEKDHQRLAEFVIFPKEEIKSVLDSLESKRLFSMEGKWFAMRFGSNGEYEDGKLGLPPSAVLTSKDLRHNPDLLVLLLAQTGLLYDYYGGNIVSDCQNKEIIIKTHLLDARTMRKTLLDESSAVEYAIAHAHRLSLEIYRPERIYSKLPTCEITPERLNLLFSAPYLYVDGVRLYEASSMPIPLIRIRQLQSDLSIRRDNQAAQNGITTGIRLHQTEIEAKTCGYYPMFKIVV